MIWLIGIIATILLFTLFPKQMIYLSIIGLVVVIGFFSYINFLDSNVRDRRAKLSEEKAKELAKVEIEVTFESNKACDEAFPLLVIISNRTSNIIYETNWVFEAHKSGYSNNLVTYGSVSTDKIINPNVAFSRCHKIPTMSGNEDPSQLNWTTSKKTVNFRRPD